MFNLNLSLTEWSARSTVTGDKDKAVQRIKHAYETNATELDLSCLNLSELPSCIAKLEHLRDLFLNINKLKTLPEEIGNLSKLRLITLDYNKELNELPQSLGNIPTLTAITTGGTGISEKTVQNLINSAAEKNRKLGVERTIKEEPSKKTDNYETYLFSQRPQEVQKEINKVFETLQKKSIEDWRYKGNHGFYNLLSFNDSDVIAQRIKCASPDKKDLYFIDLGAGNCAWVDEVSGFLRRQYKDYNRRFHVIGVNGEGESFDCKKEYGNVITHKISGFKLENLLESFKQFDLQLEDSVEFIVSSWTFRHLVDPLGTLEQAYHLLSPNNGFMFGTGFQSPTSSLGDTLSRAFGMFSYITRKIDSDFDDFALFRDRDNYHSGAKANFRYDCEEPITRISESTKYDCFAKCLINLKPTRIRHNIDHEFGGRFHGVGTYVLEQLIGNKEITFKYDGKILTQPLFKAGTSFLKLYLDSFPIEYRVDS